MLIKINNYNLKCKFFLTTTIIFFIVGFIMFFVKTTLGIAFFIISGILNLYLNKKYPDFIKSIIDKQQKTHAGAWVKRFKNPHIQGVKFANYQQFFSCKISDKNVAFYNSEKIVMR